MSKSGSYTARVPDATGYIHYTDAEHEIWHDLISRQIPMLPGRACPQWIEAMESMRFPLDRVPQLSEINQVLARRTGWSVVPVTAKVTPNTPCPLPPVSTCPTSGT